MTETEKPLKYFNEYGISFEYPSDWELTKEVDETNGEIQINIAAGDSSFWLISLYFADISVEELYNQSIKVFQEEYPELDIYKVNTELAGNKCLGCDIEFVCSELINSAYLRLFQTELFTALVLYQGTDQDLKTTLTDLEAISNSLDCFGSDYQGYLDII
ncbi:MAG: hypothetical protein P1V19_19140 [Gimesia sp.]|nr:hypothetical protein [Gimesia sp.]